MTFLEYTESVRARYLDFYRSKLAELRTAQPACAAELLIKPDGAQNPEPFCLMRLDAIYQENGEFKIVRVALDQEPPSIGPTFSVGNLSISTGTLSWESATLSFHSPTFDVAALEKWLSKWLDVTELRKADDTGLAGLAHSISWSQTPEHAWEVSLDLGSAPPEALFEALDVVAAFGVREVHLETKPEQA